VRTFVLKPTLLGGLIRTRSLAERASASGRSFVISHLLEGEIARAACAHLALALGGLAAGLGDHPALARLSGGRHAAWIGPAWIEPPRAAGLGLTHD
jgi:L-alanine-DL-glutamate epimerase-like enolase superfamily enzyme